MPDIVKVEAILRHEPMGFAFQEHVSTGNPALDCNKMGDPALKQPMSLFNGHWIPDPPPYHSGKDF